MKFDDFLHSYENLLAGSPVLPLDPGSKVVVMSDLHLGDGSAKDDLAHNRVLIKTALRDWYYERGYSLVLNGDIEDVQKFRLGDIRRAWMPLTSIFDDFHRAGRLHKIVGNHDLSLLREADYPWELHHGLRMTWGDRSLFAFHGHQASRFFVQFDYLSEFVVRFLAKPLRIRNSSVSRDSRQKYKTEQRIYKASKKLGVVSITGHTHRPLFESMSKMDSLRMAIETLLQEWAVASPERRDRIADLVALYREDFERHEARRRRKKEGSGLYAKGGLIVPTLFNSGCATGRHGMTAIEIEDGSISLVYWTDGSSTSPWIEEESIGRELVEGSSSGKFILATESLDTVFARLDLLGGEDQREIAI